MPFDTIQYATIAPIVTITFKVVHRSQFDAPVDQCEVFCLHEMETKLLQIGAQHQRWKE